MLRHLMQLTHKLDIPKRTLYSPVLNGLQSEWFEFPWCFDNWGDIINGNCVNLTPIICTCYATVSYLIFFSTNLNYAFNILWFLSRHHDHVEDIIYQTGQENLLFFLTKKKKKKFFFLNARVMPNWTHFSCLLSPF